ncbi:MAG: TraR/DksA family transcriptional regulator [bacterium]
MNAKKLKDIKQKLLAQKEELNNELNKTRDGLHSVQGEEMADFTDLSSLEMNRDFQLRLNERDLKLMKKIDTALEKIENNTYGTCEECECEISEKRLLARAVVTLCIDCKTEQEKKEQQQSIT